MKKKIIIYLSIISIIIAGISCQVRENNKQKETKNMKEESGYNKRVRDVINEYDSISNALEDSEYSYNYSEKDINKLIDVASEGLERVGFKNISEVEFMKKVETVFGFTNKTKCENIIDHKDFFSYIPEDDYKYPDDPAITINNLEYVAGTTFVKTKTFYLWTNLPDYIFLKDSMTLNPTVIHLNKYLFNDSNASLTWLMINGADFLEFLVKDFGYVKDKKLLKWVLDRNKFYYSYDENNLDDFTKILVHRTCEGKFIVHQEVLDLMTENLNIEYVRQIADYMNVVSSNISKTTFSISFEERAELVAHLLYWGEPIVQKEEYSDYIYNFMRDFVDWSDDYAPEFERRDYYHLENFKEMWDKAKEEGNGIPRRP